MPPDLALFAGYGIAAWLIRQDMRWRTAGSKILFAAAAFLTVIGSRPLAYWFGAGPNAEGHWINTVFFASLIGVCFLTLQARNVGWGDVFGRNKAMVLLYLYFAVSALWSIDAAISGKRLFKDFTCVLVALVFLTEQSPGLAARSIVVRVSYVLFPLSLVFNKYFPDIGRAFSHAGGMMVTGVTTQKNSLGELVLVFGLILIWDLVELRKGGDSRAARRQKWINIGMLALGVSLLISCDSKTSLVCLIFGGAFLVTRAAFLRMRNGRAVMIAILLGLGGLYALDNVLGISQAILTALNRDPTLTGRTEIWRSVLAQQNDEWLGGGFYMFWDDFRGRAVAEELAALNSAHSGYIETYLDGGIVGCVVLGIFLLATGRKALNGFFQDGPFAGAGLPIWITAVIYNLSETSFMRLDPLWFALLLVTIERQPSENQSAALELEIADEVEGAQQEVQDYAPAHPVRANP